ncbi:sigma-70 family RNA polymerase sigma factor [Aureibaculum sp. A20]|uniref:Sigma-70 family RNA polymerase sigma factor n=1 Tax=Aureibaculum flavum TaxID=2795986 RepID=A0ABS0WMP3_9FLAO|nr:sigma-70 family RNA polymerase sigma factor [Aureibaculum flavum]MBJ2173231.1 sigma-70 family RNA polymerase sigma factor [Aureibaculum flavum]
MDKESVNNTLEKLRKGDEAAFKRIYEENREKFLNFAKRYNLSDDENIDAYQDAYVIFYENIMSGKIENFTSSISTYLFSIGKYLIMDILKKNKKQVSSEFNLSIVKEDDNFMETIEIEEKSISKEQQLLLTYFETLGKKCQELLTLFYYRGYTINEIMKKESYNSENVVKSQKSRCMKTLRERIKSDHL